MRRALLCRPPAAAAAAPPRAKESGVFVRMEGQPLLELSEGRRAVPLLIPETHQVPFAAAVRIIQPGSPPAQVLGSGEAKDTVELLYVLGGSGALLGAGGARQPVGPGDSVIAAQGAALFEAPPADGPPGDARPLVLLQLLLPGKLLRDIAGGQGSCFTPVDELRIRPDWSSPAVIKAGRLSQELMCSLLSPDASLLASARDGARGSAAHGSDVIRTATASVDDVTLESYSDGAPVQKRSLGGVRAWQLPNATNQLALMFGPHTDPDLSFTFGVEMFEPGHRTTRHIHTSAYEMFIVLGGQGVGINNGEKVPLRAGDVAVFPPHVVHAIDNTSDARLYCLQMMLPNDMFAEYVTSGSLLDPLDASDMAGIISGSC